MELKEAINKLKETQDNLILTFKDDEELNGAIDIVLKELNNRMPRKDIDKLQKVIDLMAEQMSKRPLMVFKGNENSVEILREPKEIIDYYTKKAEEENE